MGRLIYAMNVSLDGYAATLDGSLDWTLVDDELHTWFNDFERGLDASLYGRRLYELMNAYWPTAESDPQATQTMREFAQIWRDTPRVVFSTTLTEVGPNARLTRGDVADVLAALRKEFSGDIGIGGPTLAASFIGRGLVDEFRLIVHPVVLGGGLPFWPSLDTPIRLRLIERRDFKSGAVYLGYRAQH